MKKFLAVTVFSLSFAQITVAADFTLTSSDVRNGASISEQHVFNGFGCQGANLSPALTWNGAPAGTKSFAVTVYDPDAPRSSPKFAVKFVRFDQ